MADTAAAAASLSLGPNPRIVAYGGGVQSNALLVLSARGVLPYKTFLFANVGDDSEDPATLDYVRDVAMPYASEHGLTIHELRKYRVKSVASGEAGTVETLWGRMMKEDSDSLPIPVYMDPTRTPMGRTCTGGFKVQVMASWLKARGVSKDNPAEIALGISTDEIERANAKKANPWERLVYPLLDLGLSRTSAASLIVEEKLPEPPKSACFFCPYRPLSSFREMKRARPELFEKAVELETRLRERRAQRPCKGGGELAVKGACPHCKKGFVAVPDGRVPEHGRSAVYLTRFGKPLEEAVGEGTQGNLFAEGPEECDSGHCFT